MGVEVRSQQLICELCISHICVGQLEHTACDPAGLARFDRVQEGGYLDLVYENEGMKIYQVRE